jgi:hypothetical protein
MESDTVRLTYQGGVRGVSMLVQMLEEQGVSVQYTMPRETRDMTEAAAIVAVVLSATGNIHDIAAAVQKFRQKFGAHAQIEDLPEPMQSVEERLAAVDRLLANGKAPNVLDRVRGSWEPFWPNGSVVVSSPAAHRCHGVQPPDELRQVRHT